MSDQGMDDGERERLVRCEERIKNMQKAIDRLQVSWYSSVAALLSILGGSVVAFFLK